MGVENYIFWVWKRVRIWRTRQHTPIKNSQEHLPGRICCPLVFIAQRTQKAKWCLVYFQMRKTRKSGRVKDWVCNISTHHSWRFRFWQQYCWTYTENVPNDATLRFFFHTIFMHQSISAASSTPPELLRGICPSCQSRGWGICKFCAARGLGICQPGAIPELLTHTQFAIRK